VDSIPTSANQEDHVSMGTIAARKSWDIVRNAENVLAIEFITAAQGIDFRDKKKLGRITKKAYEIVRSKVPFIDNDRELWKDVENMKTLFDELLAIMEKGK
jgi:histidine ammonia-lyase